MYALVTPKKEDALTFKYARWKFSGLAMHEGCSLGSRPSPFTLAYISKRMRYPDSLSRTGKALGRRSSWHCCDDVFT